MASRYRLAIVLALTAIVVFAEHGITSAQKVDGGAKNKQRDKDQGGRRHRNRKNDSNSGFQFGGSEAQPIQQSIQGLQSEPEVGQQQGQLDAAGGSFQGGKKFKKSQQWQNWQSNDQGDWKKKRKHDYWRNWALHVGGPEPFSAQWYSHHPHAWHYRHRHDRDAWEVATAAGVLAWLGWHVHPHHTTVIYEPVPVETIYVEGQPPVVGDPSAPGEWMTLGVYSLVTGSGDSGTRMLELAVDKQGRVRGNYYDMVTNASHTVTGRIDQATQHVQWSLDTNKQLTFFAPLSQLTQPQGVVNVRFPGGQREEWQVTRLESAGN